MRKGTNSKRVHGWAVMERAQSQKPRILIYTVARTRSQAIGRFLQSSTNFWSFYKQHGYDVKKITVEADWF